MKKPNITEGEWEVGYTTGTDGEFKDQEVLAVGIIDQTPPVCVLSKKVDENELDVNNAQAISAVPEMIDALIVTHRFMDEYGWHNIQECKEVEQALKKAGCTE